MDVGVERLQLDWPVLLPTASKQERARFAENSRQAQQAWMSIEELAEHICSRKGGKKGNNGGGRTNAERIAWLLKLFEAVKVPTSLRARAALGLKAAKFASPKWLDTCLDPLIWVLNCIRTDLDISDLRARTQGGNAALGVVLISALAPRMVKQIKTALAGNTDRPHDLTVVLDNLESQRDSVQKGHKLKHNL